MKRCPRCDQVKALSEFHKCSRNKNGVQSKCKECKNAISKEAEKTRVYTPEQMARKAEYYKTYVSANKAEIKARYRAKTVERRSAYNAAWKRANKAKVVTSTLNRVAIKLKATPKWSDQAAILEVYEFAQEFKDAGFDVQVDHIAPLRGEEVCGLHVHTNLRVCLTKHNQKKGNRLVEEMLWP